jgi:hypothetical protein
MHLHRKFAQNPYKVRNNHQLTNRNEASPPPQAASGTARPRSGAVRQRIERDGVASLQFAKALAAALDLSIQDLGTKENPMKSCSECGSSEVYRYHGEVQMYGGAEDLLPGL